MLLVAPGIAAASASLKSCIVLVCSDRIRVRDCFVLDTSSNIGKMMLLHREDIAV
jgi:hypothetical protein